MGTIGLHTYWTQALPGLLLNLQGTDLMHNAELPKQAGNIVKFCIATHELLALNWALASTGVRQANAQVNGKA